MRPHCFSRFHLPVSFRGPTRQLSCAAQAASQPSRAKIRKLLYHRFQSGGFLLVMYNRRDRRVSPAATPGAPFIPVGKDAMTPWIFFSSQPLFHHKSHYVTRFCGRFVVQTPPKRVRKIRFFSILYPRFSNISFHLQKSRLYALIFWFYPLLCKGHLSIFDLCWGDFTTPPSYYIGHLFEIFNHPRGRRGKNALSPPCIGIVALSPPPGAW